MTRSFFHSQVVVYSPISVFLIASYNLLSFFPVFIQLSISSLYYSHFSLDYIFVLCCIVENLSYKENICKIFWFSFNFFVLFLLKFRLNFRNCIIYFLQFVKKFTEYVQLTKSSMFHSYFSNCSIFALLMYR